MSKEIIEKYQELLTLEKTAQFFNISVEKLRKYFIKHNISYQKRQKHTCNHNFFSTENELSFYWAGFIAADGSVDKNRLTIILKLDDIAHLEKFKNDIQTSVEIKKFIRRESRSAFKKSEYGGCSIRINSKQIIQDLLKFGITSRKSKTYTIPQEIVNNKLFSHFIRGLIDGDGSIGLTGNNSSIFLCGTPQCVGAVSSHLKTHLLLKGGYFHINKNGLARLVFNNINDNHQIINYLYDNSSCFLDRKRIIANQILTIKPRKIPISKEDLLDAIEKHNNIKELSRYFAVSDCTIRRRVEEYKISFNLNKETKFKI